MGAPKFKVGQIVKDKAGSRWEILKPTERDLTWMPTWPIVAKKCSGGQIAHFTENGQFEEDFSSDDDLVPNTAYSVTDAIDAYQQACTDFEAAQLALEKAKAAVQDARLNLRDALDGES